MDPDPAIFVIDLQANKKLIFKKVFLLITSEKDIYIIFQKLKSQKEVTKL
jgi:hypothetical protein